MTDNKSVIYFTVTLVACGEIVIGLIRSHKVGTVIGTVIGLVLILFGSFASEISAFQNERKIKIRHIGVIVYAEPFLKSYEGLRSGLQKKSFRLDEELIFAVHSIDRDLSKVESLVKKFAAADFDLIYTVTTPVTQAVKACMLKNRINIPVVFTVVADPVNSEIVTSLRHPGANITGISHVSKELLPQRLLRFKKAFPKIKQMAIFFDPGNEISKSSFKQRSLHLAARDLDVEMVVNQIHSLDDMTNVCRGLTVTDIDSIFMLPDARSVAYFKEFLKLSRRLQVPLMVIDNMLLKQGGVMGYSPDFYAVGVQSATLVDHIFNGVLPGELAVQNPEKVKLVVSLKELRVLDLEISEDILLQADEVLR